MAKGIKRQLQMAYNNVSKEIGERAEKGFYASGLSGEGYAGGYRQALSDVFLALNGVYPNNSRYWPKEKP